jgi:hypothetical protein
LRPRFFLSDEVARQARQPALHRVVSISSTRPGHRHEPWI